MKRTQINPFFFAQKEREQIATNLLRRHSTAPSFLNQHDHNSSSITTGDPLNIVVTLCRKNRFSEAIHHLLRQNRCPTAILDILHHLHPSRPLPHPAYDSLFWFCLRHSAVEVARDVVARCLSDGFNSGILVYNRLITLFMDAGRVNEARKVFDGMHFRDACSWNSLISGYSRNGCILEARRVFEEMCEGDKDSFSWSSLMSGYVRHGQAMEALMLYREMQTKRHSKSSTYMVSCALSASNSLCCLRYGKEIHGHIFRAELVMDSVLWSTLSDMYAKCGCLDLAKVVFDKSPDKDVVSWTAMMGWYFDITRVQEGFLLFSDMVKSGICPNEYTYAGVLNACSSQTMEGSGKEVHGHMIRNLRDSCPFATAGLVDMYSKCGNVYAADIVFKGMSTPDVVSWSSIISCHAQNGNPKVALQYFKLMLDSGVKPDSISFIGVLSACTHAGLVDEGLQFFHSIVNDHGLTHTPDHYACVVDLLSRAGLFSRVILIMKQMMPTKPDKYLWSALLNGCRIHGNVSFARFAADSLFEIEPENPATYVTLANIYATAGMWEYAENIRKLMCKREVVKSPGLSWIEIKRQVHSFLVGDVSHPRIKEIYLQLEKLINKMKIEGYVPETNFVLHDVEEEQKEQNLSYHSEKLAVAFGIIETPPHTCIKIFKNLRTCGDCHTSMKFISRITRREIIVRDSSRFHHFKDGRCTCQDYW